MRARLLSALLSHKTLTPAQIDAVARSLFAQLSLDEKIGMMSGDVSFFAGLLHMSSGGYNRFPLTTADAILRLGIPGWHC